MYSWKLLQVERKTVTCTLTGAYHREFNVEDIGALARVS